ncbi:MAG: mRNA interferase YafQ [Sphingomonadales bacterium]|jgi:mRNA interferase YafQ|nr:mRNA interferase YafQ [Sphingomonadales bacterium]
MAKAGKRAAHPRACDCTRAFSKDWERLSRSGRFDMHRLKDAMLRLVAADSPLGPEWKDHPLKGEWSSHRECHVGGDFLLIYRLDESAGKAGTLVFVRAGTHSDLFGE